MKGYKVFNPDWTCRGFQYEVGKEYMHEGEIILCESGFHFCCKLVDCFSYYSFDPNNKVAEIEAIGIVEKEGNKSVTNHIRIVREMNWHEVLDTVNTGNHNTGRYNSGNYNTGNHNSGDCNSGDCNSGDCNSGNYNTGDFNLGDWNSGDFNIGNLNSGNRNSGNRNSGHFNSGHFNSGNYNSRNYNSGHFNSCSYSAGAFCNAEPEFLLFNKPSPISRDAFLWSDAYIICSRLRVVDKDENPIDYRQAWANLWGTLTDSEKRVVMDMPNFDVEVFKDITGIGLFTVNDLIL